MRNLLKKPVFEKGNADLLSQIPSVIKQYNKTSHSSKKIIPIHASKKVIEKEVCSNLQDGGVKQLRKFKLCQLVRTSDIKSIFSKGDNTNYIYKLYTITEIIHYTIPSYRINNLLERSNENLLLPTKLSPEETSKVMKELN